VQSTTSSYLPPYNYLTILLEVLLARGAPPIPLEVVVVGAEPLSRLVGIAAVILAAVPITASALPDGVIGTTLDCATLAGGDSKENGFLANPTIHLNVLPAPIGVDVVEVQAPSNVHPTVRARGVGVGLQLSLTTPYRNSLIEQVHRDILQ
jgi:hypothetical protein